MSGAGLAADYDGYIYLLDANGTFDTTLDANGMPINGDYGNAFLKISTSPKLAVTDYFTMSDTVAESDDDLDLGSGGVVVLPDVYDNQGQVHRLAVGSGKNSNIYVADRDNMGKFNPKPDNIYQEILLGVRYGVFAAPAYFNNTVYIGAEFNYLKAFTLSNAKLSVLPTSQTPNAFAYPGPTPSISFQLGLKRNRLGDGEQQPGGAARL